MTTLARTRMLLVVVVAILGGSIWLLVDHQRTSLLRGQAQTASAGDLLSAMLDQETGIRGYALTGSEEFLAPYKSGRSDFLAAIAAAGRRLDPDDADGRSQIRAQADAAERWHLLAGGAVTSVQANGPNTLTVADARRRKSIMDEFRRLNAVFQEHVQEHATKDLDASQWSASALVVLIGTVLLGGGLGILERSARRSARRRTEEQEFIETLQGADDESEAQGLLQRHVERSLPGAASVVLSRNASRNLLCASTDPSRVAGLAERLDGAAPRDCLAIRRSTPYDRQSGGDPLQSCGICGALPGASRCTPTLVAGEVIGSLLVTHPKGIDHGCDESLTRAVTQAAPVLANLRNLAIAEHRAATDGLTGLPNARSVRETLSRMVAQSHRSGAPLSAIALDLDKFKSLNDRYGHQAGDDALAAVGAVLKSGLRASDFAGRSGGEEFIMLLPDTASDGAVQAAGKLRELIAAIKVPAVPAGVTASLGVATIPEHGADGDELFRAADRALYAAKASGRDRVVLAGDESFVTAASA